LPCQPPPRLLLRVLPGLSGKDTAWPAAGRMKFRVPGSSGSVPVTTRSAAPRRAGSAPRSAPG
jgi:hypothetical protein